MIEDKDHRIDQYFRDALEDLNIIPPADVWNNIAENLPEKKRSRKMIVWIAVAASVAVFAVFSGWNYLQKTALTKHRVEGIQTAVQTETSENPVPGKSSGKAQMAGPVHEGTASVPLIASDNQPAATSKKETGRMTERSGSESARPQTTGMEENRPVPENEASFAENYEATPDLTSGSETMLTSIGITALQVPVRYEMNLHPADSIPMYDDILAYAEEDASPHKDRWSIGGQMAPLYSYRSITEVNVPGISKASMDKAEKAVVTYASGIVVDFEASPRLSFQTGVYYMKMGQEIDNISNLAKPVSKMDKNLAYAADMSLGASNKQTVANSTGTIVAPDPDLYFKGSLNSEMQAYAPGNLPLSPANIETRKNIAQSFEFIELPLLARYKIVNRKVRVHLLGGVSTHVLVDNKAVLKDANSTIEGKTTGVETLNYSSSVGFGVGYALRKNLSFNVEPTFKYYLNSFNTGDAVRLHPYALGLYSGVLLKF